MRSINFSSSNLAVQWQYVKRNLKEMNIWQDIEYKVKDTIKGTIQTICREEFAGAIGAKKYERNSSRKDKRDGYYTRSLGTTYGRIDNIKIPKARKLRPEFKIFGRYQRRQDKFDEMILLSLLLGLSTRKQKKFFKEFIGDCVSHQTASKVIKDLEVGLRDYRNRALTDSYRFIFLDGIWVHIKELDVKNRPILFALGMKHSGEVEMIGFKLAKGETEQAWSSFLNDLYRRGLTGGNLELAICDNCKGVRAALDYVYTYTPVQLCSTHKLRNILSKITKKCSKKSLIREASKIFRSSNRQEANRRYKLFIKHWQDIEPNAVRTLKRDISYYFTYFNFPKEIRNSIKTTNKLERVFKELRRTTRRIGCFQNIKSLNLYMFGLLKVSDFLPKDIQHEDMSKKKEKLREFTYA